MYIGRNIKCNYVNKNIINNIRILDETDSDEEYSSSDELPSTEITTTHYTLENDNCISTCEKCFSFNNCT